MIAEIEDLQLGPAREILQGGTRLLWDPGVRLRLLSKIRSNKNLW
jgi:hypothetical protein